LLDVSRIRAGKLEFRPARHDLAALVHEAVAEQRLQQPERTINLEITAPAPVPVDVDPDRIEQVLANYLTNALKYSADDQPVQVRLEMADGVAHVAVRDQGPGIPAHEQAPVWEMFHRIEGMKVQSGSGVGLGMGLHISRTIVERHGGQVGVESVPGEGSTFWFTVPLAADE
ncbi:MAG TPA: HAMP domain-containing sensor histidine kinase, partial [Ktedonobacterales bacterium]|nr:HAMP domain-containing sensor histidine kinase [Ktedonobacterales bacterium]